MSHLPLTSPTQNGDRACKDLTTLELAQMLADRLAIAPSDWHRLKSNRKVRSSEQLSAALIFLLKDQPEEALIRLQQAAGWLDRSISAPPCPTHGHSSVKAQNEIAG